MADSFPQSISEKPSKSDSSILVVPRDHVRLSPPGSDGFHRQSGDVDGVLDYLWDELQRRAINPVQVTAHGDGVAIQILNVWCYHFDRALRELSCRYLRPEGSRPVIADDVPLGLPPDNDWLNVLMQQCVHDDWRFGALVRNKDMRPHLLLQSLMRRCRRRRLFLRLPALVLGLVIPDASPRKLCLSLRWPKLKGQLLTMGDCKRFLRHQSELMVLADENKQLMRLYFAGLKADRLLAFGESLQRLKHACQAEGIKPRMWKLLSSYGDRCLDGAYLRKSDRTAWERVISFALQLQSCDLSKPPARSVIYALQRDYVDPNGATISFTSYMETIPASALRLALLEAETLQSPKQLRYFVRHQLLFAAEYLCSFALSLDTNQQRAGWHWIMKRSAQWYIQKAAEEKALTRSWTSLIDNVALGEFACVALTDSFLLWEEGNAMRHCVATYTDLCLAGESRIFSVRSSGSKKRVATAELGLNEVGRWDLRAVRGFANSEVSATVRSIGLALAATYNCAVMEHRNRILAKFEC